MSEDPDLEFEALVKDTFPRQMITSWIIVAESVSGDGKDIHVASSDNMTFWLASGMLHCAEDIILNSGFPHQEEEQNEQDPDS